MKSLYLKTLFAAALVIPSMAQASKSRLTALGQDGNGSLFIEDSRNIFLNPAHVNHAKKQANIEWGTKRSDTGTGTALGSPKAEGGLVMEAFNFNVGLQLGRDGAAAQSMANASEYTNANSGFFIPSNSFELTAGRDNWAGAILYANSDTDTKDASAYPDSEGQILTGKFGMFMDRISGYLHFDLTAKSETDLSASAKEKYDSNLAVRLGGTYELSDDRKIGVTINRGGYDFDAGTTEKGERTTQSIQVDYFVTLKQTEKDMFYLSAGVLNSSNETDFDAGAGLTNEETKVLALPISLGFETMTKEWLTLRGSLTQRVLIDKTENKTSAGSETEANNTTDTTVSAGTGLVFGDLSIDATFAGSTNGTGNFNSTNMLAMIGMNYTY